MSSLPMQSARSAELGMVHVAVTPHPVVRNMQRNTFVCYSCKRTRTYMLPGKPDIDFREGEAAQHA